MADMRRFGPADLLLLLLVLAVAGGLRAGYLFSCADRSRSDGPLRVQDPSPVLTDIVPPEEMRGGERPTELDVLIHNVQHERWFGSPAPFAPHEERTAHVAPGYPWLFGNLARYVPDDRLDSTVRWIQMALGTLAAGFYYLFARRAFRSLTVGALAGLLTACHPFWIIDTATLGDGTLASFALAASLLLAGQVGEKGGALPSVLFGLSLAGLSLVRAALLPFSFVAFVWFLLRSRSLPGGWLPALLTFLGFATGLAPWMVRNYQLFQEPVPVVSSAWLHLWIGNNPEATGGPATPKMLESAPGPKLRQETSQTKRYYSLGKLVIEEVRNHPERTLQRRIRAALAFFLGERWLIDGTLAERTSETEEVTPEWLRNAYPVTLQAVMLGMLGLAFLGWRWSYGWRWESIPAALAMMWVPIPYIVSHAEGLSGPRLPLDGVLLCFAAFAVVALIPGLNGRLLDAPDAGPKGAPQGTT
jgi:4-amino-4-deoxy-L-arabinose transferase-like glycosyltransferase